MYKAVLVDFVASGARWPLDLLFKVDSVFDSEKKSFGIRRQQIFGS